MTFIDRVIDVIGANENEPDTSFREIFSPVGEIQWISRWSSSGQKHHVFIGFKDVGSANRALNVSIPRTGNPPRDWRLSRLNPDLRSKCVENLSKKWQKMYNKEVALELAEQGTSGQGAASGQPVPGPSSFTRSQGGVEPFLGPPIAIPDPWGDPTTMYSGGFLPPQLPGVGPPPLWNTGPSTYEPPYKAPPPPPWSVPPPPPSAPAPLPTAPNDAESIESLHRLNSNAPTHLRAQSGLSTNIRPRSASPTRWNGEVRRAASPTSPARNPPNRSFMQRNNYQSFEPQERDGRFQEPRYGRRSPPATPAGSRRQSPPARRHSPPPNRSTDKDPRGIQRRDSRFDERGGERDSWVRNGRGRSRSRSPERLRSRSPPRTPREPRSFTQARDARSSNDFRRPSDPRTSIPAPSSSIDRAQASLIGLSELIHNQPSSDMTSHDLLKTLSTGSAPIAAWMEVISRYRRQNDLDAADQAALAAIEHFKQVNASDPEVSKPFYLVLANTHSTRMRRSTVNSEEANSWQAKASDWIRQAQALGASNEGASPDDSTDGLKWLQAHMLDRLLPDITSTQALSAIRNHDVLIGSDTLSDLLLDTTEQSKHQHLISQLKAEQIVRKRMEEKIKSLEGLWRAAEAKLAAAETQAPDSLGVESKSASQKSEPLRRAEAEKLRLLSIISDERLAKRRAEDAEQEERVMRRKLEDKLWSLGANVDV